MSDAWYETYKALLRDFMRTRGQPVAEHAYYGWIDYGASRHVAKGACSWVIPEGARLTEAEFYQFTDTFHSASQHSGIDVAGCHCACGTHADVTLRYEGTLAELTRFFCKGSGEIAL